MNGADLETLKFNEVVRRVHLLDGSDGNHIPLRIGFLRNITVDHICTYWKFFCYYDNLKADVYMGEYDNIMQEVLNSDSPLFQHEPDIIVVCLKKELLCGELTNSFVSLTQEKIDSEVERVLDTFDTILMAIRRNSNAVVLVHNFEVPVYPAYGVLDYQERYKQVNTFRRINNKLLDIIHQYKGVYVVDIDLLQSVLGDMHFLDSRYWHIGRAPYTVSASKAIAKEYMKFIRALKGRNKKCLVLDCDNTLWGGIVGEDGVENIKLGRTYPGSAFREFQDAILDLYHRGVLLGICSKNNEQDVIEVLEKHPDMLLKRECFLSMKINWRDKVSNLREMAHELNLGLDSFVFIDDSEVEINMVRKFLPEVECILLPPDPSQFKHALNACGLFDSLTFSNEDRNRSEMYRAEIMRKKTASQLKDLSIDDYYRYLEMEVFIKSADAFSIPRIAQLTQRTNQFNLTTKRYSESEIADLAASSEADVRFLRLKDRFGDSGIVGVAILRYEKTKCLVDTFLLSCRVIGRGIEDVLLSDCKSVARKRNCKEVFGFYIATSKNEQVESFYIDRGFESLGEKEVCRQYALSLGGTALHLPAYFKTIKSDCDEIAMGDLW